MAPVSNTSPRLKCLLVRTAAAGLAWAALVSAAASEDRALTNNASVANAGVGKLDAVQVMRQVKTVFVIPLENHDLTQPDPMGEAAQILGNAAAPYLNSLLTPGDPNAAQVSYAARYYNVGQGVHPSEPNYVWSEAGTSFGVYVDADPSLDTGNLFTCQHLTGQMNAVGIPWRSYQEDLEYTSSASVSSTGTNAAVNVYNGSNYYVYMAKHNPMELFTDTQNTNVYPLAQLWVDLDNNAVGRYNWVTPDACNEMHNWLPNGFTYNGVFFWEDQAAIAQGDNCLSMMIPTIMASQAYKDNGLIIIWTDETATTSTDDTNTALVEILISPLAKGNAYASQVAMSHSSDLKSMDEIFGLAFQTNAIPVRDIDAFGTGYNYVAAANDLSDLFQGSPGNNGPGMLSIALDANRLTLTMAGIPGQSYHVEGSTDLRNWVNLVPVVAGTNGLLQFVDTNFSLYPKRFYRVGP
ncbi:MAG: alkaline phosphatase family protein [Limisphaerales bacterium]